MTLLRCILIQILLTYSSQKEVRACEEPPDIDFGYIVSGEKSEYVESDRVQYRCYPGYTLIQSEWITCNGSWTPPPKCLAPCTITKQQLEDKNMFLRSGRRRTVVIQSAQIIEFSCSKGYKLTTPSVRACVDGHIHFPLCISEVQCGVVPSVENAVIKGEARDSYKSGETVRYQCHQGFSMIGAPDITCRGGNWTKPPTCADGTCAPPPDIAMGGILETKRLRYFPGERVDYQCQHGLNLTGSQTLTCMEGEWSPAEPPECRDATGKCGPPPTIENGDTIYFALPFYELGSVVEYKCKTTYALVGSRFVRCDFGQWTNPPTCREPCAASTNEMEKNNIRLKWMHGDKLVVSSGDVVEFECKRGYVNDPTSPSFRAWCLRGVLIYPKCKLRETLCGTVPSILNGIPEGRTRDYYEPGATVRYQCQEGFDISATPVITCQAGKWSTPPTCVEGGGRCGKPPAIDNGDITFFPLNDYDPHSTLEYKCKHLYVMRGSQFVSCKSGQWTDPPVCIEPCTASEEDMAKNNIQLKWSPGHKLYSPSGDVIEFTCKRGYVKDPESPPFRVRCLEGELTYPKCRLRGTSG
ncbi:complement factor H-related protein 5 precursor [Alligator mississippiensis]|uniref:Complement factor H-related protein 5 n=1 Tax=Alligator mississippiensis TaxID=8496 RepID=A0A151N4H6_ALLMI|nr:complement factor H-related protein 5 precursor [Alligator mississippiensis]